MERGLETLIFILLWYRGNWSNNSRHGRGIEKSKDGLYNGDMQYDKKHGQGSIIYNDGSTYEGNWSNNALAASAADVAALTFVVSISIVVIKTISANLATSAVRYA